MLFAISVEGAPFYYRVFSTRESVEYEKDRLGGFGRSVLLMFNCLVAGDLYEPYQRGYDRR
jgi:hypothetical protein